MSINGIMPNRISAEKMVVYVNMFDHRVKQSVQGTMTIGNKDSFLLGRIKEYPGRWRLKLVKSIEKLPECQGLRGVLIIRDAHALYEKYGNQILNGIAMVKGLCADDTVTSNISLSRLFLGGRIHETFLCFIYI